MVIGRSQPEQGYPSPVESDPPPIVQVVGERVGLLGSLRDAALPEDGADPLARAEALAAAECYARLAAAIGVESDSRALVSILLDRARLLTAGCLQDRLRHDALHHLKVLAVCGDDAAADEADALSGELGDTDDSSSAEAAAAFERAAHGDTALLLGLADAAMATTAIGVPKSQAMIQAEHYARYAHSLGCPTATICLAGVLLLRWDDGASIDCAVEAIGLIFPFVEQGEPQASALLTIALTDLTQADLQYLVTRLPALLFHFRPEGNA